MGKLVLITGGARSGKSRHAVRLATELACGGKVVFVATCVPADDEMRERVRKHRKARPRDWPTVEEPERPSEAVRRADADVAVVDCVTLLLSNLLLAGRDEKAILHEVGELARAAGTLPRAGLIVTNEVGCGIVPANALSRRFRDLIGAANQLLAAAADEVLMMVCGLPLKLK